MATVLVVDDEPDLVELLRLILEFEGYDVLTAGRGAEALEIVEIERPDVVVLDVMMPEIDGFEVLARLKGSPDPGVAGIPVIMCTAKAADTDRIRGGIEGAVQYVTKPFGPERFLAEVERALTGGPEAVQRRRAQQEALGHLARLERGEA
ncbi:MAG: response regulator transcription factor, partial [Acidimicrobiales bacterium]